MVNHFKWFFGYLYIWFVNITLTNISTYWNIHCILVFHKLNNLRLNDTLLVLNFSFIGNFKLHSTRLLKVWFKLHFPCVSDFIYLYYVFLSGLHFRICQWLSNVGYSFLEFFVFIWGYIVFILFKIHFDGFIGGIYTLVGLDLVRCK